MSCPEVMYQAYYPYLYQRPGTSAPPPTNVHRTTHFSPFAHHQYDRFNVQRCLDQQSASTLGNSTETYQLTPQHHSHSSHHSSAGSISSGGGGIGSPGSPTTPNTIRYKEEDLTVSKEERREAVDAEDDDDDAASTNSSSRAQYLSANCVVFTSYTGDVSTVVDEHFSRALSYASDSKNPIITTKDHSPMIQRNFPPSFWNSNYQPIPQTLTSSALHTTASVSVAADFYSGESAYHAAVAAAASTSTATDPWHSHYQQYAAHHHHRAVHEYHHHHHNMAAQYSSLLLPSTSRLPAHMASHQYHHHHHPKTGVGVGMEHWPSSHTTAAAASHHRLHHEQTTSHHGLDPSSSPYASYPSMSGLEAAQVQEPSKDLYWF